LKIAHIGLSRRTRTRVRISFSTEDHTSTANYHHKQPTLVLTFLNSQSTGCFYSETILPFPLSVHDASLTAHQSVSRSTCLSELNVCFLDASQLTTKKNIALISLVSAHLCFLVSILTTHTGSCFGARARSDIGFCDAAMMRRSVADVLRDESHRCWMVLRREDL
jgi:hypothetical protein